ncbi:MAG TPA: hypothetical protein VHF70_04955 [Rubrobacteraceae bacterium]|nr:hypothetical protein [Rubrobacteraceae bacterium]
MKTLPKSAFGSPDRASVSAAALLTLASALALALVALALSATPAQATERDAATTPVNGGKTLLELDGGTAAALSDAGVEVEATGKAVGPTGKAIFRFPIVGGKVDKDPLGGRIVHSGGLAFSAGSERVKVRRFVIDLDRGVLTAEVAGAGQRIALLRLGAPEGGTRVGSEVLVLRDVDARLTARAAAALNAAFDTALFEAGLPIGEATVDAQIGDDDE